MALEVEIAVGTASRDPRLFNAGDSGCIKDFVGEGIMLFGTLVDALVDAPGPGLPESPSTSTCVGSAAGGPILGLVTGDH